MLFFEERKIMRISNESALETVLKEAASNAKSYFVRHDRGVILGFVLSLVPAPPIAFLGFIISIVNGLLWKCGKLELSEISLIKKSMVVSLLMFLASSAIWYYFLNLASSEIPATLQYVISMLKDFSYYLLNFLRNLNPLSHNGNLV